MATIYNTTSNTLLSGTSGNDTIENGSEDREEHGGDYVTILGGGGSDDIYNVYGSNVIINGGTCDDFIGNYSGGENSTISCGAGKDSVVNEGSNVIIDGGSGNDSIENFDVAYAATINGGKGNDYIENAANGVKIYGGSGNDEIDNDGDNVTINGGEGKDTIFLSAYYASQSNNILIQYALGDGNDVIQGFDSNDTLQITSGSYSTAQSGSDLIVYVGNGSITLKDVSNAKIVTVNGGSSSGGGDEKNSWKLSGTAATYGTSSKTLATVSGAKSVKGLSTSGKKITLKNSALSKKVTVRGSYEFDFASGYKNATISGTSKADTITARGKNLKIFGGKGKDSIKMVGTNHTVSGGAGADTFIYAANGGNEKILDFKSNDKLKIGEDGDGNYSTVTSGDNLIVSTDDGGKITLVGAASLSNVDIVGTKKTSGKGVKVSGNGKKITLTSDFDDSSFSLSGKYSSAVTLDASAALLDLSITGNKFANKITGSSQNDTIDGGKGADTIYGGDGSDSIFGGAGDDEIHGGKGKDTLWGGAGDDALYGDDGKDVFYYNTGEGNDTIFGYEASVDKIVLASGTISNVTTDRNNNVIFSVGDGQIVVNNCADRTVKIVNSSGKIVDNGLYEP